MNFSNKISIYFGRFAGYKFPKFIQKFINKVYVKIFDIDLSEFDDIDSYESLSALFTRSLRKKRSVESSVDSIISPSDSLITQVGISSNNLALQIKGMEYRVDELLGERIDKNLAYINLYLSPKDYHHYHAPCDLQITKISYFSGRLLPVNMPSLKKNNSLFIQNERVVLKAKMPNDKSLYFVAVGALNVGSIIFLCESKIKSNAGLNNAVYEYDKPIAVKKGEELGFFNMGSTIVLLSDGAEFESKQDSKVAFGNRIGKLL